ncbi:MAG: hypothetical protein Q9167_003860 [Letrouitia subvulpina]
MTVITVLQYTPANATVELAVGSTARIWQHPFDHGVVIKAQITEPQEDSHKRKFDNEARILEKMVEHPRIVKYLGPLNPLKPNQDLLFQEAAHGDLQQYINTYGSSIDERLRVKWCRQAAEALAHCHRQKILHCDLRPDNMLLSADLDLCLCDFGGSKSGEDDGHGLPDYGFFDPRVDDLEVTEAIEIFGLGSSLYFIMVGRLPHGPSALRTIQERLDYKQEFSRRAFQGQFPDTSNIIGGDIIQACWEQTTASAEEVCIHYKMLEIAIKNS